MDEDLKQLLTQMREENTAAHLETRQNVDTAISGIRQENAGVRQDISGIRHENAAMHAETRHQFVIVAESLEQKIELVVEGVTTNTQRLERLEVKVDRITDDLDARLTRLEAASFRSDR